jgi:hypothetical protein
MNECEVRECTKKIVERDEPVGWTESSELAQAYIDAKDGKPEALKQLAGVGDGD